MVLRDVLNLMDHEVWVRVRPHGPIRWGKDVAVWSADWHGGDYDHKIDKYLDWCADDLSTEVHQNPEVKCVALEPMIVVCVYSPEYFGMGCESAEGE